MSSPLGVNLAPGGDLDPMGIPWGECLPLRSPLGLN
jgi:hypothetical protein